MLNPLLVTHVLLALLATPFIALSDAAPPENPPGSSILPAGETMVQMVAETVTISVGAHAGLDSAVSVTALFSMRNLGEDAESMQVRFPLENPNGLGDGWGQHPLISGFSVKKDGIPLPVSYTEEALGDNPPIQWATFPVTFLPGNDVLLSVSYDLALSAGGGTDQAKVEYILETGAGWYDTIESAVVTFRLPYAASESNVYVSDPWNPQKVPPPVFVGSEVRWEWSSFEPTPSDNLQIVFIWPATWDEILSLEAQTGEDPSNVPLAIQLAEAYRKAGSERHGFAVSDPLYRLALQAVQIALPLSPSSPEILWEKFMVQAWKCTSFPPCDDETLHRLIEDYRRLPPYPDEALPEELKRIIYRLEEDTSLSLAASPQPTRPPTTPGPPRTPSELGPEIAPTMPHSTPSACATSTPISEPTSAHESSAAATPLAALATAAVLTLVLVTLLKRPKGG